jgi:hypothetical protein
MMKEEDIYKYVGIFAISMILIYIITKILRTQNNIIEGLTNQSNPLKIQSDLFANLDKHLKETNDRLADSLLIKKYKSQYEDTIIEIDNNSDLRILQLTILYGNAVASSDNEKASKYLEEITMIKNLRDSLKDTMKYIDKH